MVEEISNIVYAKVLEMKSHENASIIKTNNGPSTHLLGFKRPVAISLVVVICLKREIHGFGDNLIEVDRNWGTVTAFVNSSLQNMFILL